MTLRLIYICDEYPPFRNGGIGTFTKEMAEQLVSRGHDVTVIGIYQDAVADIVTQRGGVTIVQLSPTGFGRIADQIKLYRQVRALHREQHIDCLECQEVGGNLAFWPKVPFKIIVRLHGSISHTDNVLGRSNWKNHIWKVLERSTLRKADHIISVSAYTADCTRVIFKLTQPIEVAYNGIALPKTAIPIQTDDAPFQVVYAGSMLAQKGILSLLHAWPSVRKALPDAQLHLAGKDTAGIWSTIPDILHNDATSVTYHGTLEKSDLETLYAQSHLAIFPSYVEAFSLAPMEAMAVGLPVIFTKRTSGPELITDGVTGRLVDPDDIEGIACTIIEIARMSPMQRAALGQRGQTHIQNNFTIDQLVDKTEDTLHRLTKTKICSHFHGHLAKHVLPK
jgi:glycosyltransferase involved in cell wall biosynthesis